MDKIIIKGLNVFAYHGVNPEEKRDGQNFILDIELTVDISLPCSTDNVNDTVNYSAASKAAVRAFTARSYDLIEKAAQAVCDALFEQFKSISAIDITLKKPMAPVKLQFDYMAVRLHRSRTETPDGKSTVLLSLGSDMGDREQNLRSAVNALRHLPGTLVNSISKVYRTKPFMVDDSHPEYLNCCVEISTTLSPRALMGALLGIEATFNRERVCGKVLPRELDIDMLLYRGVCSNDTELTLPHPRMGIRAFVLVPLADIYPDCKADWFDFSARLEACDKNDITPTDIKL